VNHLTYVEPSEKQELPVYQKESGCLLRCESISSITSESNSHLTQIESFAFYESLLRSIVIPQNVQFIDSSAFIDANFSSISIASGKDIFVIENDFLTAVLPQKLI
jgi:hypothetical protein